MERDFLAAPVATIRPYLSADSHGHEQLRLALTQAGGNKTRAAQRLGLTERQFSYRWRKLQTTP
jgi:Nif-specific regulatory protein